VESLQTVQFFGGSIRHREKLRLVNQAMVNCIQGDEKLFADFFVAEALGDNLNKFFFAVA
jgi:hypothetical protein